MKQRIGIILLTLALMLSLCACAPEKDVIQAIDAIGEVTVESGDAIAHAEALFEELDEEAQEKVTNWDVLLDARSEYDRQVKLIEDAADLVDSIGEVTLEKGDAIAAARAAYDKAEEYDLLNTLKKHKQTLEDAEEQYAQELEETSAVLESLRSDLSSGNYDAIPGKAAPYVEKLPEGQWRTDFADVAAEAICEQAMGHYVAGDVGYAMDTVAKGTDFVSYCSADKAETLQNLTEEIVDVYTMVEKLSTLVSDEKYGQVESLVTPYLDIYPSGKGKQQLADIMVQCMVLEATSQYGSGNNKAAMDILNRCVKYKGVCSTDMLNTVETERTTIIDALSKKTPKNGAIIERTYNAGRNTFTVTAGDYDTLVKLQLIDEPDKYVLVYVKANQKVKVNLQNGTYRIMYTCGPVWYGNEDMFGDDATFVKLSSTMSLRGYTSGRYIYYHSVTCTLKDGYGSKWGYQNMAPSTF